MFLDSVGCHVELAQLRGCSRKYTVASATGLPATSNTRPIKVMRCAGSSPSPVRDQTAADCSDRRSFAGVASRGKGGAALRHHEITTALAAAHTVAANNTHNGLSAEPRSI